MRHVLSVPVFVLVAISALGCGSSADGGSSSDAVSQTVGPAGGTIVVGGATVTFPKGALAESKLITIRATDARPDGFVIASRVFECDPSGTSFAEPVTMRMPFTDDGSGQLRMFWSTAEKPAFADVGGTAEGGFMTATVRHFSAGFVGLPKK